MIEQASLIIGDGNWAVKSDSLLGYALPQGKYVPREMNVVRATTGTRVNEAGLVELVPYNLLQYSEQFENAYWTKNNNTITANAITAPNGTLTADALFETAVNDSHEISTTLFIDQTGTDYSFSFFVKSNGRTKGFIQQIYIGGAFPNVTASFDLVAKTITDASGNGGVFSNATINEFDNGWFRISVSGRTGVNNNIQFRLYPANNSGDASYLGDITKGLYIWGAQVVEGTLPLTYLPTTTRLNIPRIDYSTGSAALLVEPQRTNVLTYSSQFDNSAWVKSQSSISANATTAPDGTLSADKIIEDTSASGYHQAYQTAITATIGVYYTFSFYAKSAERSQILGLSQVQNEYGVLFDLATGTHSVLFGSPSNVTMTDAGNGWYRCSITGVSTQALLTYSNLIISKNGVQSYAGDGISGLYIWGAQLEVGSYPTSYIPTTSASVTRNADQVSKTGISNWIGQTEGTIFLDYIWNNNASDVIPIAVNGDGGKFIWFRLNGVQFYGNGSSLVFNHSPGNGTYNQRYKLAFVYGQNDFRVYMNGVLVASQTSGTFSGAFNEILFTPIGSTPYNDSTKHNAVALWKTRLTNSELAQLTTI